MSVLIPTAKKLYGRLPPFTRSAAASAYGYYLRWWRYGPETERLVEAALERDAWGPEQWQRWQRPRLEEMLHRAATRVPYYRDHWRARRADGDDSPWEELSNWPLLDKEQVRREPRAFLADDTSERELFRLTTSGTSGTPVTTWRSRRTMRAWYALVEARSRRWYGVDRRMPWAILGGQLVTPAEQREPPFWVWNAGLRQLYMSALHLSPDNAEAYAEALERHGVRHMYGYASSMYALASMLQDRNVRPPQLEVAVSNAEPLHPHQRRKIGEVFGCPVRDSYGMSEIVAAASECDHGRLHLWPDAGVVEIVGGEDGSPVPRGRSGELVCTGLSNLDMPLVRYRVGDRGALSASREGCPCGRGLPVIERIEGRVSDNLLTPDGRRVFWLNPVFYDLPVREGQIVQTALAKVHVNVVPGAGFDDACERELRDRLVQRLGSVDVVVHRVDEIAREANGKLKPVVNRLEGA